MNNYFHGIQTSRQVLGGGLGSILAKYVIFAMDKVPLGTGISPITSNIPYQ
jgi:hypothetical protein